MKKTEASYYYKKIILLNIKKLRIINGISEEFISAKLGISQSFYSKLEAGNIQNINTYWSEIAKILSVPPMVLALPDCLSIIYIDINAEIKIRKSKINENEILEKYFNLLKEKDLSRIKYIKKLKERIRILNEEITALKNLNSYFEYELKELKRKGSNI